MPTCAPWTHTSRSKLRPCTTSIGPSPPTGRGPSGPSCRTSPPCCSTLRKWYAPRTRLASSAHSSPTWPSSRSIPSPRPAPTRSPHPLPRPPRLPPPRPHRPSAPRPHRLTASCPPTRTRRTPPSVGAGASPTLEKQSASRT